MYAGAGLALLLFITLFARLAEYSRAKTRNEKKRTEKGRQYFLFTILICIPLFIVIPFIIYFASYVPYFNKAYIDATEAGRGFNFSSMWKVFWKNQTDMFNYHSNLTEPHLCQSPWYQWPLQWKSTWFYSSNTLSGLYSNISTTGNPIIFIGGSIGAISLFISWITGQTKKSKALLLFLIAILSSLLPWVFVTRAVFLYHFFATVPFLIFSSLYLLMDIEERHPKYSKLKWIILIAAAVVFALMYPAISGLPMPTWYAWFLEYCLPAGNLFYGRIPIS
jgi:hypothetical protein